MAAAPLHVDRAFAATSAGSPLTPFSYDSRPLQPWDADLRITHCGVCASDLHSVNNDWGTTKYPIVPGHEIVGIVTRVGPAAKDAGMVKVGQRVGVGPCVGGCRKCEDCTKGEHQLCRRQVGVYNSKDAAGHWTYGGFANAIRVDARHAYPIPDKLPSETAAPLFCAGITVFSPLARWIKPGVTRVGVVGIGGLGHLALQFAKALGAVKVVAMSTSANKEDLARSFGADGFIVTKDKAQMKAARRSLDLILSTVNVDLNWHSYLRLLANSGTLCLVGIPPSPVSVHPAVLILRRLNICGSPIGSGDEVRHMLRVASEKGIVAKTELYPMEQVNDAFKRVHSNKVRFRCVLRTKEDAAQIRARL